MIQPSVSVVTPFFNSAQYLSQCIESVLAQSYSHFEYILSDNCSTDGSREIAEVYAQRDPRIRLIRQPRFLSQVQHYNSALAAISNGTKYCKMVQADDLIFPDCLQLMVRAFEQSDSIGLVSSYDLKGNTVRGSGFPFRTPRLPGREMARLYLRTGVYVFGSPTTVMYRSCLVRNGQPFYDESRLHEDTEKCVQILEHWDFGFVHQVLSFLRTDNESISSAVRTFQPAALDWFIMVQRYAPVFFDDREAETIRRNSKQAYYSVLADEALSLRGRAFWRYHRAGLQTLDYTLERSYLASRIGKELLWMTANPGIAFQRAISILRRLLRRLKSSRKSNVPIVKDEHRGLLIRCKGILGFRNSKAHSSSPPP